MNPSYAYASSPNRELSGDPIGSNAGMCKQASEVENACNQQDSLIDRLEERANRVEGRFAAVLRMSPPPEGAKNIRPDGPSAPLAHALTTNNLRLEKVLSILEGLLTRCEL